MEVFKSITFVLLLALLSACSGTQKIKSGEEAYQYLQYQTAIQLLSEEYERSTIPPEKAHKAYLIAKSFAANDDLNLALQWFRTAYDLDYGEQALFDYAVIMKRLERYDSAMKIFEALSKSAEFQIMARQEMQACKTALVWKTNKVAYTVEPVSFNSAGSEYSPILYLDDQIAFVSDRPQSTGDYTFNWTGRKFSDIFLAPAHRTGEEPHLFNDIVNSDANEGPLAFSKDYQTIFFTRCSAPEEERDYCKIYFSRKGPYVWSDPVELSFVQPGFNYRHPTVDASDSIMIFSSDMPNGQGGFDLYYTRLSGTKWSDPVNLGPRVNSQGNESFPWLYLDTLYFASDRVGGMGGLDIYQTYVMDDGNWAPPQNLKPPINSGADDFGFIVDRKAQLHSGELEKGYFSSSRDGMGKDDIYRYTKTVVQPDTPKVVTQEPEKPYVIYLALRVVEKLLENPDDPNSKVIGKQPVSRAKVTINGSPYVANINGFVIIPIKHDESLQATAAMEGYLSNSLDFRSPPQEEGQYEVTVNKEVYLDRIYQGKEIILQNIYYDLDKWDIRDDAKPALDALIKILKDNPSIRIQLASHTDCRASDEYNLGLSQKRAQSAVDYLVSNGIDPGRLIAKGFGKTQLIEKCPCEECTEEQHQINRRTTFTIL
ncbi:MAG: OmpA family protein [Saprospiraceae bacterium]